MTEMQTAVLNWLANGHTGLSSETFAFWAAFDVRKDGVHYPLDPADFNRCLLLLQAAPALRAHLPKMSSLSPEWARLVDRWSDIEAVFIREVGLNWSKGRKLSATETYALMKAVIAGEEPGLRKAV